MIPLFVLLTTINRLKHRFQFISLPRQVLVLSSVGYPWNRHLSWAKAKKPRKVPSQSAEMVRSAHISPAASKWLPSSTQTTRDDVRLKIHGICQLQHHHPTELPKKGKRQDDAAVNVGSGNTYMDRGRRSCDTRKALSWNCNLNWDTFFTAEDALHTPQPYFQRSTNARKMFYVESPSQLSWNQPTTDYCPLAVHHLFPVSTLLVPSCCASDTTLIGKWGQFTWFDASLWSGWLGTGIKAGGRILYYPAVNPDRASDTGLTSKLVYLVCDWNQTCLPLFDNIWNAPAL